MFKETLLLVEAFEMRHFLVLFQMLKRNSSLDIDYSLLDIGHFLLYCTTYG